MGHFLFHSPREVLRDGAAVISESLVTTAKDGRARGHSFVAAPLLFLLLLGQTTLLRSSFIVSPSRQIAKGTHSLTLRSLGLSHTPQQNC